MEKTYMSPQEVADLLKLKKNTVYEMIKRGEIKATKMGKQYRIEPASVYAYMGTEIEDDSPDKIVICGQDILLDLLCGRFNSAGTKTRAIRMALGSYRGIYEMYQSENYAATCHLWDADTDSYNLPYLKGMLPGEKVQVYHLLDRWQGFYVKKGNPKNITKFEDLTRNDVRMVNRDKGSGIRVYVDEMIRKLGIDKKDINGYDDVADSHLIAATMVMRQNIDVAIGSEKNAQLVEGIDFIPQKKESYDIVFRESDLKKAEFQRLLAIIQSEEFKEDASTIDTYDITDIGKRIL